MYLKLDLIIRYVPASDDCNILSANIGIISKKYQFMETSVSKAALAPAQLVPLR